VLDLRAVMLYLFLFGIQVVSETSWVHERQQFDLLFLEFLSHEMKLFVLYLLHKHCKVSLHFKLVALSFILG